ncbi:uncharacterized aarF domain-containing protein kinase 2 isoform X1 [Polypterus senegalus]|uniref:uncharacterized aarF domain-containing protein kinase 2 isoform X1 n=2 Tax=Polypterus senegalus TaxID=55291 RepID=UPI0019639CF4|nr:uncharacterized aarF domain-containing protein kinase 2 isoform X1 [Polypterus senegalus]
MSFLAARSFLLTVKLFVRKNTSFPYASFQLRNIQKFLRTHKGSSLTIVSKLTLVCWSVSKLALSSIHCQEAVKNSDFKLCREVSQNKSVFSVQVHKLRFFLHLGVRSFFLCLKFTPLILLYPFTLLSSKISSLWLDLLLWTMESCGPTFVKLAQWASTRPDLFSREFCSKFSRLHVHVKPHSWVYTTLCLKKAFGDEWDKVFNFESKQPVGSGCVAQVYKAHAHVDYIKDPEFHHLVNSLEKEDLYEAWEIPGLHGILNLFKGKSDSNQSHRGELQLPDLSSNKHLIPVAVKVLHPGITHQVQVDLLLMKAGSWLVSCLPGLKWLSLPEVVVEFEKLMVRQIDLRYEARNMERFSENFNNVEFVKFPTPLRPFVTKNILVETFEESEPIFKYLSHDTPTELKQKIARMGVNTLLKMIFVDNFVHGDLHPGNILVQWGKQNTPHGTMTLLDMCDTLIVNMRPSPAEVHLVLLDAGIVSELSGTDLKNLHAVFSAVVLGQGAKVAELILHHARASECSSVEKFKLEMAELVNEARKNTITLEKLHVADLLSRVFRLLITHKVKLESNFASIVFAIMVLEGVGRSLDPNLDILEMAKPFLLKNCASLV